MAELILIRHGQASFGAADYDRLSALGHEQSRALGTALKEAGIAPDRWVIGAQRRHRETLEGIAEGLGMMPDAEVHEGLSEFDADGLLSAAHPQGLPDGVGEERRAHFQALRDAVLAWQRGEVADPPETFSTFTARVAAARAQLTRAGATLVVAVSSGGPISRMVVDLLKAPADQMMALQLQLKNCALTRIVFNERAAYLHTFNETPHIAGPASPYLTYS